MMASLRSVPMQSQMHGKRRPRSKRRVCLSIISSIVLVAALLAACEANEDVDPPRTLLVNSEGQILRITLRFSLWFPNFEEEDYDLDSFSNDPDNNIRQGVTEAFLDVLCSESDLLVHGYFGNDVCKTRLYKSTENRRLDESSAAQFGAPSIIASDPEVIVRRKGSEPLVWSTWIVSYPVLQIGDIHIQEALLDQPNLPFSLLADSSAKAMEQVAQLALDVSIMEGNFDRVLKETFEIIMDDPMRVYSSPVRKELDAFGTLQGEIIIDDDNEHPVFSGMRMVGVVLMFLTLTSCASLNYLSKRRRLKLVLQERKLKVRLEQVERPLLISQQGIEEMLAKSSDPLGLGLASTNPPSHSRQSSFRSIGSAQSRRTNDLDGACFDKIAVSVSFDGSVEGCLAPDGGHARKYGKGSYSDSDSGDEGMRDILELPHSLRMSGSNKKARPIT
jgi:hypothetical protein